MSKVVATVAVQVVAIVAGAVVTFVAGPVAGALVAGAISMGGAFLISAFNKPAAEQLALPGKQTADPGVARDRQQIVRAAIQPRRVIMGETRVSGAVMFFASSGPEREYLHMVLALATHECDAIGEVQFNDVPSTDPRFAGFHRINRHLGGPGQVADADLIAECPQWTGEHVLHGIAYLYVRLKWSADVWLTGIPNITAIVRGKKVRDPRSGAVAWSNNPALCILDYMQGAYGLAAPDAEIGLPYWIAAANACDEQVQVAGGTQTRYTLDGAFELDSQPRSIVEALLTSCVGTVAFTQGRYRLFVAVATAPVFTLTRTLLRGDLRILPRAPRGRLFNAVRGTFVNPAEQWQPADFPPQLNALYESEDNGERIYKDISLPFTKDATRAQRIAKVVLELARQPILVEAPCKPMALSLGLYDVVYVDEPDLGWAGKQFRVMSWGVADELGVDLVLREEAPTAYDWNLGQATAYDPAPDTLLPDPWIVLRPENLLIESGDDQLLVANDGTVISRIRATWARPPDAFVIGYTLEFKRSAETGWSSVELGPAQTEYWIAPVKDGDSYDVRVFARNTLGARSALAVEVLKHIVVGKTAPPPDVSTFTVTRTADGTRVYRWTMASIPADVRVGGGFEIRWSNDPGAIWETMTPLHTGLVIASPFESNELGAGVYKFAIKAVDSSGNRSVDATEASATLGDPRLKSVLLARYERDLGWPGTRTDCYVDDNGTLKADSTGVWDDLGDATWDDLGDATWDTLLGNASPITYVTPVIDLGIDVYVNPLVSSTGSGVATYQMKSGLAADGTVVGSFDVLAGVKCRYVQFEIVVTGTSPRLDSLTILLDGENVVEQWLQINTSSYAESGIFERAGAGHIKIRTRGGMSVITQANLAFIAVGGVRTWEIVSKSATVGGQGPAAEIKLYNSAGTLVDAVIDVELRGPKVA